MFNISLSQIIIFLIFTQCFCLYKIFYHRSMSQKKDIKLIQNYLDMKLLQEMLSDNLTITNDKEFYSHAISLITEYFDLDKIIIIDSLKEASDCISDHDDNNDDTYQKIIKYLTIHKQDFIDTLSANQLFLLEMNAKDYDLNLHISYLISDESSDGMVICVESASSALSKVETDTLAAVINLLKKRLLS